MHKVIYECVQSLCDHTDRVRALTVSANGTLFFTLRGRDY